MTRIFDLPTASAWLYYFPLVMIRKCFMTDVIYLCLYLHITRKNLQHYTKNNFSQVYSGLGRLGKCSMEQKILKVIALMYIKVETYMFT